MTREFSKVVGELARGYRIIPVLRAAFSNPTFQGFDVHVPGWNERPYDGWFHPSTHGAWAARQLALYLRHGEQMPLEKPTLNFVLAVTQGSFWHEVIQRVMLERGLLLRNEGTTWADSIEKQVELALVDPELNLRGHADGRMSSDDELFEFKTMGSHWKMDKITCEDELREQNPFGYWEQTQDYLAISGREASRYLILNMGAGFRMVEFVVRADKAFQAAQRTKYRQAIEAAQENRLPPACCSIGSTTAKNCPARQFCDIGRASR